MASRVVSPIHALVLLISRAAMFICKVYSTLENGIEKPTGFSGSNKKIKLITKRYSQTGNQASPKVVFCSVVASDLLL
ncbi:hypothetical protein C4D60_Mb05t29570 [Musa balbisiana]|uniref:Secreted protein n=1 Tax=Musa balbisiana TaxID=52838 RepID=A0A4S8JZX7_MUSBA|nr:hypothetical protein C4D60_Mb05t29570 [Musa balbisiana]